MARMANIFVIVALSSMHPFPAARLRSKGHPNASASHIQAASVVEQGARQSSAAWASTPRFASDCGPVKKGAKGFRRHRLNLAQARNPGVGMDLDAITPYETVFKDDFSFVICVMDGLFSDADKYGTNAFDYKVEDKWNVSIIRYESMVALEDQESMSQKVCFDFCRTVPGMSFFGLTHGRDCYCAPFYHDVAGDASMCDLPCVGDPTPTSGMCGGKSKSAIFEMHMCGETGQDLAKALAEGATLSSLASNMSKQAMDVAAGMQLAAEEQEEMWGQAGDPVAADLMQKSKVWAGELEHATEALAAKNEEMSALLEKGEPMTGYDFSSSSSVREAEALMGDLEDTGMVGKDLYEATEEIYYLSTRGKDADDKSKEYYPLMYFVDKKYEAMPSTCGGTWDGHSIYNVTVGECAAACDEQKVKPDCTGFFHSSGLCLLFSKFKSVTYYTGCPKPEKGTQVPSCYAKLEDFVDASLAPDPSGKCELCLKEATKADRCYQTDESK